MKLHAAILIMSLCLIGSCSPAGWSGSSTPAGAAVTQNETSEARPAVEVGENAIIETVAIGYPPGWLDEIELEINGHLPDGCTEIHDAAYSKDGNIFSVQLFTSRPKDAYCTEALVPFSITVPLDLRGLETGLYEVRVYDQEIQFERAVVDEPEAQGG